MRPSNTGPRCVGRYPVTHRPVTRCPGQLRRPPPAGAHRPRHAPSSSGDPMGAPPEDSSRLLRRVTSRRESGRLPAERLAAAVDLAAPSSTARVWGPTQRPLVRAAAPAAPAPVSGTDWKPARFFREAGAQRTLEPACGRVRAKVCSELPLPQRSLNVGGAVGTTGRDHGAGPRGGTRRRDQALGPDACGSQKRAPKTARLARNIPLRITSTNHGAFSTWIAMVIERLLRTVEKGTCGVGSRRRVLGSGPAAWSRCGVPLWGPHCKPRRHDTTSSRDAAPRRLPATRRCVVPATAASSTAAQRVRSRNPPGRCARLHNATRCGSDTSLCAQLSSEPTKLVSTTGKLPPGSRPSAAPRSGQRLSAGGEGPAWEPSRGLRCIQRPFWAMPK